MALRSLARTLWRAPVVTGSPRMSPPSGSRPLTSQGTYGMKREQDKAFHRWHAEFMKRSSEELKESRRSEMLNLVLGGVAGVGLLGLHTVLCLGSGFFLGVFFTLEEIRKVAGELNKKSESTSPQALEEIRKVAGELNQNFESTSPQDLEEIRKVAGELNQKSESTSPQGQGTEVCRLQLDQDS